MCLLTRIRPFSWEGPLAKVCLDSASTALVEESDHGARPGRTVEWGKGPLPIVSNVDADSDTDSDTYAESDTESDPTRLRHEI